MLSILAAGAAGGALAAQDQAADAAPRERRSAWQVGAFIGGAQNSPNDGILGTIPHRDHFMLGVQAGTPVLRLGPVRVSYIAQLLPVFIVRDRAASDFNPYLDANGLPRLPQRAYAVGISPFGIEVASPASSAP